MTPQLSTIARAENSDLAEALAQLTFTRTVDRSLLHRSALSEVFLTDSRALRDSRYVAAAQLPPSHAYYGDQLFDRSFVDPLLLMECCRQAETYGAHVYRQVAGDDKFILRSWSMRLPGLLHAPVGGEAAGLSMVVETKRPKGIGGRLSGLSFDISMLLAGVVVGTVVMDVGYLSPQTYDHLRSRRPTGTAPLSTQVTSTPATVSPRRVGRQNRANVLLREVVVHRDSATATVRLPVDNRSMFDHPQDHLPGMVLTDAARQLCVLAGAKLSGASPARTTVVGFDLAFARYAELDRPTTATCVPGAPLDGELVAALPAVRAYRVSFAQGGQVIADGRILTSTLPRAGRPYAPDAS
jgi:2-oxo-3-(phosphooxy)propyl 3-oxoalkanoate synthase